MNTPAWLDKARQTMTALGMEAALVAEGRSSIDTVNELVMRLDEQLSAHAGVPSAREMNELFAKARTDAFSDAFAKLRADDDVSPKSASVFPEHA